MAYSEPRELSELHGKHIVLCGKGEASEHAEAETRESQPQEEVVRKRDRAGD